MEEEKLNEGEENLDKGHISLAPPEISKYKRPWHRLTWWRPLTKREGAHFSIMILKISEAVLNLERVQKKLITNNNALIRQIQGQKMVNAERQEGPIEKPKEKPDHSNMYQ